MSTEAIVLFISAALALAAYLIVSSMRNSRREREELARARARADQARLEAEEAREQRTLWEQRLAAAASDFERQRDAILEGGDPRGLGDGLGIVVKDTRRRRFARTADDVPAPFSSDYERADA